MSYPLEIALTVTPLPKTVAGDVVKRWGGCYAEALVTNPSIGVHINELGVVPAAKMAEAVRVGNPEALAAVIDGRERRSAVVVSALKHCRISTRDVIELATNLKATKAADEICRDNYPRQAQRAALGRTSANARIEWLAHYGDDEECWAAIAASEEGKISWYSLLGALLVKDSLRVRAFESGREDLMRAACWTELPVQYHEAAGEFAVEYDRLADSSTVMAGLLNQPNLNADVRERLEGILEAQVAEIIRVQRESQAATGNEIRNPRGIWRKGLSRRKTGATPVAEITDEVLLANVVRAASMSTKVNIAGRERAITLPLLYELSRNPHLGAHKPDVMVALRAHKDWHHGKGNVALVVAAENLGMKQAKAGTGSKKSGGTVHEIQHWSGLDAENLALPLDLLGRGHTGTGLITQSVRTSSREACQAAARALGSGTSPESREAWRYFFSLLESTDAVSVGDVVDMAKGLANADAHEAIIRR